VGWGPPPPPPFFWVAPPPPPPELWLPLRYAPLLDLREWQKSSLYKKSALRVRIQNNWYFSQAGKRSHNIFDVVAKQCSTTLHETE